MDAQRLADELRHDEKLHQLAMKVVFVLEDCLFALEQTRDELSKDASHFQR